MAWSRSQPCTGAKYYQLKRAVEDGKKMALEVLPALKMEKDGSLNLALEPSITS